MITCLYMSTGGVPWTRGGMNVTVTASARLLRGSALPLYLQIKERLLDQIRSGDLQPGDRVPSESQLVVQFGVGRPTVRQAVSELVREGYLTRRKGAGSFVRARGARLPFPNLAGTTAMFREADGPIRSRVLEAARLPASGLPFAAGWPGEVLRVRRARGPEGRPVVYEENYLPLALFPGLEREPLEDRSLFRLLESRYLIRLHDVEQQLAAAGAPQPAAAALAVAEGTPLLCVERESHLEDGQTVEHSFLWFRTDEYRFHQHLTRGEE
jgi:GntR family transcriptional regulator